MPPPRPTRRSVPCRACERWVEYDVPACRRCGTTDPGDTARRARQRQTALVVGAAVAAAGLAALLGLR